MHGPLRRGVKEPELCPRCSKTSKSRNLEPTGPRALGSRSILGDPRSPTMQKFLNLKVKNRESFQPFAPAVLREDVSRWFEFDCDSPHMLLVAPLVQSQRHEMSAEEEKLFGIEKLNVQKVLNSCRHSCRLFGARANRAYGNESAVPCADFRVQERN